MSDDSVKNADLELDVTTAPEQESDSPETEEKSGRTGRPRKPIDSEQVRRLAELQCTAKEIAYVMGVSADTIRRNHRDDLEIGYTYGKIKLRRAMFRNATEKDNPTIQIWLSKQWLGYQDSPNNSDDNQILPWETDGE